MDPQSVCYSCGVTLPTAYALMGICIDCVQADVIREQRDQQGDPFMPGYSWQRGDS